MGRQVLVHLLPAAALASMLALIIGNYGTVIRERLQVVVLILPFVAFGLAKRKGLVVEMSADGKTAAAEGDLPTRPIPSGFPGT